MWHGSCEVGLCLTVKLKLRLFRRKRWSHKQVILVMVIKGLGDLVQIKVKHEIWQVQNTRLTGHRSQVPVIALVINN